MPRYIPSLACWWLPPPSPCKSGCWCARIFKPPPASAVTHRERKIITAAVHAVAKTGVCHVEGGEQKAVSGVQAGARKNGRTAHRQNEIENFRPPLESGRVDFLHFCLNVDQQIRLGLRRRLCPGSDDPLTENALHDRRFRVVRAEGITADEPLAVGDFERKMLTPLDLRSRRFHGGEEAVKILAALTEGGVDDLL